MSANIMQEIYFLMHSIVLGVFITFVYDWIRIFRRIVAHNLFFISIEDMLFWIACSIKIFLMLYQENNGMLRWFAIVGAAWGMMLYKILFGRLFVKYVTLVLQKLLYFLKKIISIFMRPFYLLLRVIKRFFRKVRIIFRKCTKVLKYRLTAFIKMIKIVLCKQ